MPRQKQEKAEPEITNPTVVDIDLAAAAFMAGRRVEKLGLHGEAVAETFAGCVTELRPQTNEFKAIRYMGKAIKEAHGMEGERSYGG